MQPSNLPLHALALAATLCLAPAAARAQQAAAPESAASAAARKADDPLGLNSIVVTGASIKTTKFETSYGITTYDSEQIALVKPLTALSLLAEVPGVFADTAGGESSGNLFVRGLPSNGGEKFVPLLQDGLPVYYEPEVGFLNADTFFKMSPMIERTEFARGGPSAVFYSHASVGAFNFLNRRGTKTLQGEFNLEFGSNNRIKESGYVSGPINESLSYAAGGYYRVDDGQRPPGFTANHGGELKTALTFRNRDTTASVYAYALNDHTYFQTNLPFLNTSSDASTIKPASIPGLNINTGSLASTDLQRVTLWQGGQPYERDLGDGIHSSFNSIGFELFHDFRNGWKLESRSRRTTGTNDFNGMFSGGTALGTDVVAVNPTNPYWVNLKAAFPTITQLQLRYHSSPGQVFDPVNQNGNGQIAPQGWWNGLITVDNVMQEFRETKSFDLAGTHNVTFGQFFSFAKLHTQDNLNFGSLLTELKSQPRVLDLVGLDASGNVVGNYTHDGFTSFAGYLNNVQDETRSTALFVNDDWRVNDRLRMDAGIRVERAKINTSFENSNVVDLRGSTIVGGSNDYAFKNVNVLNGSYNAYSPSFTARSWSVGADYTITPNIAAFARYSQPQRLPRTEDGWGGPNPAQLTQKMTSLEGGAKLNYRDVAAFISLYSTDYKSYPFYSYIVDGVTGVRTPKFTLGATQSRGVEAEAVWRPGHGAFDVGINLTLSRSTFSSFRVIDQNIDALGNVITSDNDYSGKRVPQVPNVIYQLTPGYNFEIAGMPGRVFATYRHTGERYTAADNLFKMPGYDELALGGNIDVSDNFRLQFNIQNALNSTGFTGGGCNNCGTLSTSSNVLGANTPVYEGRPLLPRAYYVTASYKF